MCDVTSFCDAWTFDKKLKSCWFKQRHGWLVVDNTNNDSGFKNQGPFVEENTNFSGGGYICPSE